MEYKRFK